MAAGYDEGVLALGLSPAAPLLTGGDVSEIPRMEAGGVRYSDARGAPGDPFALLRRAGWTLVRFRVWNAPKDGFCDVPHTLALARRAREAGLKVSLDLHYSDTWADPAHQTKPAAWKGLPFDALARAVRGFTRETVAAFVAQGTPPYMVQVGNEIRPGMLWPEGKVGAEDDAQAWPRLGKLLKAGLAGVREGAGKARVLTMLHLDSGGDNAACRWWFDHALAEGVSFDAIGLSYYPFWHGPPAALAANLDDLAKRYGKDLYVIETAYPYEWGADAGRYAHNSGKSGADFPVTPQGQAAFVRALRTIVAEVPNGRGRGLLWWAPLEATTKEGRSPWSNLAGVTKEGRMLPVIEALGG